MIGAIQFLGVEWVGDHKPALEQIGPLLVASVAVFAAWLAAHTANKRQKQQLDHDRRMRDRDHLRHAVGAALATEQKAADSIIELTGERKVLEKAKLAADEIEARNGPKPNSEGEDEFREAMERANDAVRTLTQAADTTDKLTMDMISEAVRLRLFLVPEHPIIETYLELSQTIRRAYNLALAELPVRSAETKRASAELSGEIGDALRSFDLACREEFG